MGLLDALKSYVSDAAGGSINPEIGNTLGGLLNYGKNKAQYIGGLLDDNAPINRDLQNWHKKTQLGLADLIAGKEGANADYGYEQLTKMSGLAPIGMTAWHGSPHKFDKFSLDKIGTGEGAQAYGHGLYLAESPEVAQTYRVSNSGKAEFSYNGKPITDELKQSAAWLLDHHGGDKEAAKQVYQGAIGEKLSKIIDKLDPTKIQKGGALYKTDIPDEAVARFLDWDKPLSQQAPEVQNAIKSSPIGNRPDLMDRPGSDIHDLLMFDAQDKLAAQTGKARNGSQQNAVSDYLAQQGIPGIRYLDGGSRSAGQGSSNFVAFDPEMIRILERNGQPTGLQPWKPGEYKLGDLLK